MVTHDLASLIPSAIAWGTGDGKIVAIDRCRELLQSSIPWVRAYFTEALPDAATKGELRWKPRSFRRRRRLRARGHARVRLVYWLHNTVGLVRARPITSSRWFGAGLLSAAPYCSTESASAK